MSKAIRTPLHIVISLILFSGIALAHAGGHKTDQHKTKNSEHHSRASKLAFWHHHKDGQQNAKQSQAKHAPAKPAQHASSKAPAQKTSVTTKTKSQDKAKNRTTASLKK